MIFVLSGQGENIDALAQLLGAPDSKQLASWMQSHYGELFTAGQTSTDLMVRLEQYKAISNSLLKHTQTG